jgi:hypothetical protein
MQSFARLPTDPAAFSHKNHCAPSYKHGISQDMVSPNDKQLKVAREVLQQGKPFMDSALNAGYSKHVAARGGKSLIRQSKGWNAAFIRAAQEIKLDGQMLKNIITYRLVSDVTQGKDSGVTRQAELIGRLKEVDAFVRNTDIQIGVFASLADDSKVAASVEGLTAELPAASEDPKE